MKKKPRCPKTGKIRHRSLSNAIEHAKRLILANYDPTIGPYLCEHCRHYHVGHGNHVFEAGVNLLLGAT